MLDKKAMRTVTGILLCLLLSVFCAGALAQENLVLNPEIVLSGGEAEGWSPDAWDIGRSELRTDGNGLEDGCLYIRNFSENDARFVQNIAVEPGTVYRISCFIRAQGAEGKAGANISVGGSYAMSDPVYDTNGEWVERVMYGVTGEEQTEITVYLRLGGYSATTVGEAWFDRVSVTQADIVPEDMHVQLLDTFSLTGAGESEELDAQETASSGREHKTLLLMAAALLFAAGCTACYLYALRGPRRSLDEKRESGLPFALMLCAALLARLTVALFVRGFDTDINCFLSWSQTVYEVGPAAFYSSVNFCDYPPGYMYVLWLVGALRALFGLSGGGAGAVLLVKLPNIAADLFACLLLYRFTRKMFSGRGAVLFTAMYAFNPAVVLDSAGWGQTDGLLALLLAIVLTMAAERKWIRCMAVFALAVLLKPQALLFAPLGVFVLAAEVMRSEERKKEAGRAAAGLGLALLIWLGLSMPFAALQTSANYPQAPAFLQSTIWLFEKYFGTLGSYSYYTVSACNFWDLIGLNWVEIEGGLAQWAGWLAYAAAFGFAFWMYVRAKEPKKIFLICAAMLSIMFAFGLKMHERYLFPAILLLYFAGNEDNDLRIFAAALLISCAQTVNMGLVLLYDWTLLAPRAIVAATDIAVLVSCALLVWTTADVCLRGRTIAVTRIYRPSAKRLEYQEERARKASGSGLFRTADYKMALSRKEKTVVIAVTLLYSVFTFLNLGTLSAPQTSWVSVYGDEQVKVGAGEEWERTFTGEQIVFDLGQEQRFKLMYYGGICDCTFAVEFSSDGTNYTEPAVACYDQGEIFRWMVFQPMVYTSTGSLTPEGTGYVWQNARYVRLTAQQSGLVLSEVAFLSEEGEPLPVVSVTAGGADDPLALIDEQETVPGHPSYYNSSYFDEIYHVRTAYEHIHGMHTYEWTHPPLGKLLIAAGIGIFGMCPFGWRFAGALSGVIMVPLMYLMVRQISRSKLAAFFAMMLMTLDCMHFTQSRLGTIDCFAVMFIMLMYLFMFRYARMNFYHVGLKKTLLPLALCGLSFALGCATKWICIYAGVGLAVLFFWTLARRYVEFCHASAGMRAFTPEEKKIAQRAVKTFWRNTIVTCLWCCVFFVAVPLVVYYFSYYWQLTPDGNFNVRAVVELQKTMFSYHGGLGADDHYFRSPWYEWPLIVKPMWYYSGTEHMPAGYISSISCMGNPAVWWGGLAGLVYVIVRFVRSGCRDRQSIVLLVGFASQYLPWVLVPRSTFIYHYFASVPFIIACAAVWIEDIERRNRALARQIAGVWIGAAALLCAMFYPIMSGTPIPRSYAKYLRWFNWYNY